MGILLENTPFVKFIRNCIQDLSGIFSISSQVEEIDDVIIVLGWLFVHILKEHYMLARRHEFYVLVARTISHSFAALTHETIILATRT